MHVTGRNEACPCGSGKKFKRCCGLAEVQTSTSRPPRVVVPDNIIATVPKAIQLGIEHHQAGRLRKAEASYRAVLAVEPEHPDANHLLGLVAHQRGRHTEAIELISHAITLNSGAAMFYNNRGEAYRAAGALDEALADYQTAISLQPQLVPAWHNQGLTLILKGDPEAAARCFERVLALDPNHAEGHYSLGNALQMLGKTQEAIASYRKVAAGHPIAPWAYNNIATALRRDAKFDEAIEFHRQALTCAPNDVDLLFHFSATLKDAGRDEEAIGILTRIIEIDPSHTSAPHFLNALRGVTSDRPPKEYIRETFDFYAKDFDHHLVDKLDCKIPALLRDLLVRAESEPLFFNNVLDLGCGTGLMGVELQPLTAKLVGVDLSPGMIAKAAERNIYERLEAADLLEFLNAALPGSYDAVVAADVFNYLGDLAPVFAEAHRVLRPGGAFLFSVERLAAGEGYRLGKTARYAHSEQYIRHSAASAGLMIISCDIAPLRLEKGTPVEGLLYLLKRPTGD